ncbi:prepilin-type N-terminal cleavage/methylation domain-containing protein [Candidatus Pacearchaeota archaeon]|nr:prepilin-type N-terminal cleavage/methylation domain-containing protein [Candidatus Pacearchaeota archaeon]
MLKLKIRAFRQIPDGVRVSRCENSGFTMLEVVVALAVMSISVLGVFGVMRACSFASGQSTFLTESTLLAERLVTETSHKKPVVYQTTQGTTGWLHWTITVTPTGRDNLASLSVKVSPQQQPQRYFELLSLIHVVPESGGQ